MFRVSCLPGLGYCSWGKEVQRQERTRIQVASCKPGAVLHRGQGRQSAGGFFGKRLQNGDYQQAFPQGQLGGSSLPRASKNL